MAPLIAVFAEASLFAAQSGIDLIDRLDGQIEAAKTALRGTRRDAAVWKVLPYLIAQPVINSQYLRSTVGLSKPQAERALRALADADILTPRNTAKRNIVWEHRGILDVFDDYASSLRRQ